ncbi:YsnF/AvaK domain-containing protein [Clostridium cylindrosporum]|uniref:DUF2382 domain-containing protein n=1 Tax=Clostridium cylindrosporum DSM 605 TaxID=1121307 RepID=A0A0J8DC99_CLOCY|nr:YsnF/AvaK domain-containing protein [Clostridium cylindrosporum]KMT21929.1 hypothetical protein CLCY_3c02000 [Clostridium cylindrosporum DSM 605]
MSIFGGLFNNDNDTKKQNNSDNAKLRLHKEELDINKYSVQKGEVELGKEIIEEQKTVEVPVTREEIVIERKCINNESSNSCITNEEPIKIPVNEERIDVDKRTVVTGEVSAHKRTIESTERIDETLKREEVLVNKIGNPDVVDSSSNNQ